VNLHFTALEMDNCEDTQTCQIDASQAKALVFWVAQAADADQVIIKGENAGRRGHQRSRLGQHRKRLQMGLLLCREESDHRRDFEATVPPDAGESHLSLPASRSLDPQL
jgi:hypothetical protein